MHDGSLRSILGLRSIVLRKKDREIDQIDFGIECLLSSFYYLLLTWLMPVFSSYIRRKNKKFAFEDDFGTDFQIQRKLQS